MLRKFLFHIVFLFSLSSFGQKTTLKDTIRINEVIVNSHNFLSGSVDKIVLLDSSVLRDYSHDNISDVISENTPIFIKNYGTGGIATISLRGTGAGYTQLAWNGVNINSPMLGQTDLSLISAGFIDDVNIFYGGASLSLNSGGIGGIINLETKPEWKNGTDFLANLSTGSFGRYSTLLKVTTGNKNFQSSTKAIFNSAENDFHYINKLSPDGPVTEKRKNAATNQKSFMQEFYFLKEKNVVSARIWYQEADRNIPVPIGNWQPEPGENQKDESLRTMIDYKSYKGRTDFNSSISWFSEKLNYLDPSLSINSKNLTNTLVLKSGFDSDIDEKTRFSVTLSDEFNVANSINYNAKEVRNLSSITASARRIFGERIGISALIRQTLKDNILLIPDFSTGLDYRIFHNKEHFVKVNFSHNSKVPTLNDMYWNPEGNISLKNESSYTSEITYDMSGSAYSLLNFKAQMSLFYIMIDDLIKWQPTQFGYWSPVNIDKSNSAGVEGNIGLSYTKNSFKIKLSAKYAWNSAHLLRSQDDPTSKGKQIVYIPEHLFNTSIRASYKRYYLSWITSFTSKRFTTTDNSDYLKGYLLNNFSTGLKIGSGKNTLDINVKIDNLFNVNYQAIALYPMPGRSFILSIIYQFTR